MALLPPPPDMLGGNLIIWPKFCQIMLELEKMGRERVHGIPNPPFLIGYQWRIQDYPKVGASTLQGVSTYHFAKLSQKLHENERIWIPPLDPPLAIQRYGKAIQRSRVYKTWRE